MIGVMTWIYNYIHVKQPDVIILAEGMDEKLHPT